MIYCKHFEVLESQILSSPAQQQKMCLDTHSPIAPTNIDTIEVSSTASCIKKCCRERVNKPACSTKTYPTTCRRYKYKTSSTCLDWVCMEGYVRHWIGPKRSRHSVTNSKIPSRKDHDHLNQHRFSLKVSLGTLYFTVPKHITHTIRY